MPSVTLYIASFYVTLTTHLSFAQEIVIHTNYSLLESTLSGFQTGHGIEDVNHELIGGCSVQMVFGEGFEEPRGTIDVSGASGGPARTTWWPGTEKSCKFFVETGDALTGLQSQAIQTFPPFDTVCVIDNLGLDSEGMYFGEGESFDFAIWAKLLTGGNNSFLNVSLIDTLSGSTLASGVINLMISSNWMRYNLSLTSTGPNTTCVFDDTSPLVACFSNAEKLCPSCSGALRIAFGSTSTTGYVATVLLDQVSLSAASGNARGPAPGAAATRSDVASLIARGNGKMGLTALRLGGSAILVDEYRWKRFRGPAELRQPYNGFWYQFGSSSSYGFFEFLSLCESLQIPLCVVTMNSEESLEDVYDFLEYVYGNATTTVWGAQRAADGHIEPYVPFAIEIGNENDHTNKEYISLVAAFAQTLRTAALRLEIPFMIPVCIGVTPGTWPPESILPLVAALYNTSDVLDLMIDFHIGGDNPNTDAETALVFISSVRDVLANSSFKSVMRGAVLEENGGRHDMQRGLGHARNANRLRCIGDFVRIETAANGFQVLGRNDNDWDQGALFITQNSAYLSPHGMVNIPLSSMNETGAALVPVEATGPPPLLDVIALVRADGNVVKISAVNIGSTEIALNLSMRGCTSNPGSYMDVVVVAGDSLTQQNLPGQPLSVFPVYKSVPVIAGFEPTFPFVFLPYSVTSIVIECTVGQPADEFTLWPGYVSTTCDIPSPGAPQNFSYNGYEWEYFNNGPWQVDQENLTLFCGAADENCFDEAISMNGPQLPGNGSVSVNVTFAVNGASYSGDDDAGLIIRCGLVAVEGMDGFSCYEISLGSNQNGNPNSGFILVGSHFLPPPGSFQLLQKIDFDVPSGISHVLSAHVSVYCGNVTLTVSVNGIMALEVSDSAHAEDPFGGPHIGLRAFYSTATFSNLVVVVEEQEEDQYR